MNLPNLTGLMTSSMKPDDEDDGLIYEDMYYETIEEESIGDTW